MSSDLRVTMRVPASVQAVIVVVALVVTLIAGITIGRTWLQPDAAPLRLQEATVGLVSDDGGICLERSSGGRVCTQAYVLGGGTLPERGDRVRFALLEVAEGDSSVQLAVLVTD